MSTISDITIVGGGIIGMLTAYECRLAGASVTVIEKNDVGRESSWAGGGILLPIYPWRQHAAVTQLVVQSLKHYPQLIDELHAESGIDPEFIQSGMLICQNPDFDAATAWCTANSVAFQQPSDNLLATVQSRMDKPLWLPEIRQARNPRLLKAVSATLKKIGVKVITQCELLALDVYGPQVQSITTSQGTFPVNELVLAGGAWTGGLWRQFFNGAPEIEVKIEPVKGQMLLFAAKPDTLTTMVLDEGHYLIPRADGNILVGSTVEHAGFDKTVATETKEMLLSFALKTLPALANYPVIHHWAGLRPGTALGIPYIARHPEIKNLSINAGHFRNGLTMAPASAQLLTDVLLKREPSISPIPYQFDSVH